jgi:hypothetical protein
LKVWNDVVGHGIHLSRNSLVSDTAQHQSHTPGNAVHHKVPRRRLLDRCKKFRKPTRDAGADSTRYFGLRKALLSEGLLSEGPCLRSRRCVAKRPY